MRIKSISIGGLWNKYNIEWKLNDSVNILSGPNGAGKSTIVDAIRMLISEDKLIENKTNSVEINFDNDTTYGAIHFMDTVKELQRRQHESPAYLQLWSKVRKDLRNRPMNKPLEDINIDASFRISKQKGRSIDPEKLLKQIKIDFIRTFDIALPSSLIASKFDSYRSDGVNTELDLQLHELQTQYSYYLATLADALEKEFFGKSTTVTADYVESLYANKNLFKQLVNEAFAETGKEMIMRDGKLGFLIKSTDTVLSLYQLSAGEKQLLHILLTVLMEQRQEYILLMDEPEISLHVDWQSKLIRNILLLNPKCQIVIVTHSPSLIIEGWQGCVQNIEEIKHNM